MSLLFHPVVALRLDSSCTKRFTYATAHPCRYPEAPLKIAAIGDDPTSLTATISLVETVNDLAEIHP
jgi:hypothetical protein